MPRILLDRHIDEVAMQRRDDQPVPSHRWGHRRTARPVTVAQVVATAPHLRGDDRQRTVRFDDVTPADFRMPAGWVPARGADQLDHRAVVEVTRELAASVGRHAKPQQPERRIPVPPAGVVPPLRDVDDLDTLILWRPAELLAEYRTVLDEIEVALVRLYCVASDVSRRPGGRTALASTVVALDALPELPAPVDWRAELAAVERRTASRLSLAEQMATTNICDAFEALDGWSEVAA